MLLEQNTELAELIPQASERGEAMIGELHNRIVRGDAEAQSSATLKRSCEQTQVRCSDASRRNDVAYLRTVYALADKRAQS